MRKSMKLLALAAFVSLGFAANAHAIDINVGNPDRDVREHVPAVPEADTWAMMAVGLGLVGLRLRRKNRNSQGDIKK